MHEYTKGVPTIIKRSGTALRRHGRGIALIVEAGRVAQSNVPMPQPACESNNSFTDIIAIAKKRVA
jgi:hypothetical protein